jgi:hypothetical protein
MTIEETIAFGDFILLAIPWIDAMNLYSENFEVINLEPSSSSEEIAKQRGVDALWGMYQWLDRAPKGRNETGTWLRRHDEYIRDSR